MRQLQGKKIAPIKFVFHCMNSSFLKLGYVVFTPFVFILKEYILTLKQTLNYFNTDIEN